MVCVCVKVRFGSETRGKIYKGICQEMMRKGDRVGCWDYYGPEEHVRDAVHRSVRLYTKRRRRSQQVLIRLQGRCSRCQPPFTHCSRGLHARLGSPWCSLLDVVRDHRLLFFFFLPFHAKHGAPSRFALPSFVPSRQCSPIFFRYLRSSTKVRV